MKTKDGSIIYEGMLLESATKTYKVEAIDGGRVEMTEIIFEDDDPENYTFGDCIFFTEQQIATMYSI